MVEMDTFLTTLYVMGYLPKLFRLQTKHA